MRPSILFSLTLVVGILIGSWLHTVNAPLRTAQSGVLAVSPCFNNTSPVVGSVFVPEANATVFFITFDGGEEIRIGNDYKTGSMDPYFKVNGGRMVAVITKPKSEDEIHRGDIVYYSQERSTAKIPENYPDGLISHRIVEIRTDVNGKKLYRMKGDANPVVDAEIQYEDILYKYCGMLTVFDP